MKNKLMLIALAAMSVFAACDKPTRSELKTGSGIELYKATNEANGYQKREDGNISSKQSAQNADTSGYLNGSGKSVAEKIPSKIIRNATARIKVKSLSESRANIEGVLSKYNAYVSNENQNSRNGNLENEVVIRVPQVSFQKLLDEIMKQSDFIDYKNITADDVTSEYVDVQARLRTTRVALERYYELMKRAGKITEILEVEDNVRALQEEIESIEGRIKLMSDQSSYSTITVTLYELIPAEAIPSISTGSRMISALRNGWNNIVAFTIFLLNFWPFLLIIIPTLIYLRRKKAVKIA